MERFLVNYKGSHDSKCRKTKEDKLLTQRKYEKEGRSRSFLPKWSLMFNWLEFSDDVMTCKICKKYENAGTFITGCRNFKKDTISAHECSDSHQFNVKKHNAARNPEKTEAAKVLKTLNTLTLSRLTILFRTVHALGKKGRPYTDYPFICQLDEAKGLDIGTQYRTDKKAEEFSNFISESEKQRLRNALSDVKFISAISDGSTDSSYQEAEIVYIRHCHAGKINVNFSLVKNIPRGNAESICKVIVQGLENLEENFSKKLVGVGTDGAAVMLGPTSGAVERIRQLIDRPWLVAVHCSGHKLELAYKDMVKATIPLYRKIDAFLLNIYYFYRNSNVNRSMLKESFKISNRSVILPVRVGGTRWISHLKKAIECFLQGYEAITQHLGQLQNPDEASSRTEKGNRAKHFLKVATARDVWMMTHFLLDALTILVDVSKKFQDRTATVSDILLEIEMAAQSVKKLKSSDGPHLRKGVATAPDSLKGDCRAFDSARIKFVDNILSALHNRFTDKPGILRNCSVMNLSNFPTSHEEAKSYGDDDVAVLVDYFKPGLEAAGVEASKCEQEWTKLKYNMITRFDKPNHVNWQQVNEKFRQLCPNILALADLILTLPASSAEAERGFNRMKITKTDWRSKLTDSHLSDQMMIMLESASVPEFDPLPAIHLWFGHTPRRHRQPKRILEPIIINDDAATNASTGVPLTEVRTSADKENMASSSGPSTAAVNVVPNQGQAEDVEAQVQVVQLQDEYVDDVSDQDDEDYFSDDDYLDEDIDDEAILTLDQRKKEEDKAYRQLCSCGFD